MPESISSEPTTSEVANATEALEQTEQEQQQSSSADGLGVVDLGDLTELISELGKEAVDLVSSILDNIDLNF